MPLSEDQKAQIEAARAESHPTRRPTVPALEEILYEALPVLDHGFVRVGSTGEGATIRELKTQLG